MDYYTVGVSCCPMIARQGFRKEPIVTAIEDTVDGLLVSFEDGPPVVLSRVDFVDMFGGHHTELLLIHHEPREAPLPQALPATLPDVHPPRVMPMGFDVAEPWRAEAGSLGQSCVIPPAGRPCRGRP